MKVVPFYDRGELVAITVRTVLHNLLFGIALIFLIQYVFLGNLRCAIIVAATVPAALFLAVIITVVRGNSANLLSVGAIDLGIIVDATVIMVESIFRYLAHPGQSAAVADSRLTPKLNTILAGAVEVDRAILFSVIITIAAFLPLFTMQGVEGQIFGPMSRTYAYALLGCRHRHLHRYASAVVAHPVRSRRRDRDDRRPRDTQRLYAPLHLAVGHARTAALAGLAFLVVCFTIASHLGTEFLPKLEEGDVGACAAAAHDHAARRRRSPSRACARS